MLKIRSQICHVLVTFLVYLRGTLLTGEESTPVLIQNCFKFKIELHLKLVSCFISRGLIMITDSNKSIIIQKYVGTRHPVD